MNTIFAEMESADFYPEDIESNSIRITLLAPSDTYVEAGKVVLMTHERYTELVAMAEDKLLNTPK